MCRWRPEQQITVESPANADVVTLQAGISVRRTDKQKDSGLLLAMVDTVTLNRKTALAVSDDSHPAGSVQKPRAVNDENPPTSMPLRHDGLSYRFPFHTEKKTYPYFDPIAQKAFDVNYQGQEDVNGLTTYRFTQNVGYNADGKLVAPSRTRRCSPAMTTAKSPPPPRCGACRAAIRRNRSPWFGTTPRSGPSGWTP